MDSVISLSCVEQALSTGKEIISNTKMQGKRCKINTATVAFHDKDTRVSENPKPHPSHKGHQTALESNRINAAYFRCIRTERMVDATQL